MSDAAAQAWENFWQTFEALQATISKGTATNVNKVADRDAAKNLVREYFTVLQPHLTSLGFPQELLRSLDAPAQRLLELANGNNVRSSYKATIRTLRDARVAAELQLLQRAGRGAGTSPSSVAQSPTEEQILNTLRKMIPSAALSYEQGLADLRGPARVSYRGSATELREALRETLDHLAPDDEVKKQADYKPEKDEHGKDRPPTMRQKAQFILKHRGSSSPAVATARGAIKRVEEACAELARSVYTLSSVSTHSATEKKAVLDMKGYADAVLAELLQVHKPG